MTIKQLLFPLALLGFLQNTFAQSNSPARQVAAAKTAARKANSTAPFDDLLKNGNLSDPQLLSNVYALRAEQRVKSQRVELRGAKGSVNLTENPAVKAILTDYEKAIEVCPECKVLVQRDRYAFLQKMDAAQLKLAQQDSIDLKAAGYRGERQGIALLGQVVQGKNTWIGGGIALAGMLQPAYKLRANTPKSYPSSCFTALEFNYLRNMQHPINDFAFQLLRINAPIVLAPAHFGVLTGKTSEGTSIGRRWYYNPEIGWGYNGFSVSYGYRLMFKKGSFDGREGHLFKLRYTTIL